MTHIWIWIVKDRNLNTQHYIVFKIGPVCLFIVDLLFKFLLLCNIKHSDAFVSCWCFGCNSPPSLHVGSTSLLYTAQFERWNQAGRGGGASHTRPQNSATLSSALTSLQVWLTSLIDYRAKAATSKCSTVKSTGGFLVGGISAANQACFFSTFRVFNYSSPRLLV